jgi:hypothetical protein
MGARQSKVDQVEQVEENEVEEGPEETTLQVGAPDVLHLHYCC